MHGDRTAYLVGTEVGVADHGHVRILVEELHGVGRELGNVHKHILVGMAVDESVGKEEHTLLGVEDVHSGKRLILLADADNLLSHLDGVGVFGVKAGDESIRIARLHHHHAEVVALVHFVVSLLEGVALAGTLLGEVLGIGGTSALLLVGTHVDKLDAIEVELQTLSHTTQAVGVAKEDRIADALGFGLYGSLHHRRVGTLGKYDALRVHTSCVVEVACEFSLLSEKLHEVLLVSVPVGYGLARHATLDGSLGNSRTHLGDESWVDRFRNEVFRSEREVVNVVNLVDDVGHRLLGEVGNGVNGSHLHLLVDGLGMNVESTTEDVWKADNVVDLVGIVATSGRHEHVGAACHSVLVADFGHRIGKSEDDRLVGHRANHVLREHVALR